jgi:Holliday junction resolvase RusA-like endonuclease
VTVLPTPASVAGRGEPAGGATCGQHPSAVSFTLPTPPSTNVLFRNVPKKGRVKTQAYIDWQMAARVSLRRQKIEGIAGRVVVMLGFERSSDQADVDNRIKAVLDILSDTHGVGIIDDDRFVTALLVSWLPPANGLAHVRVVPVQHLTAEFHPALSGASGSWIVNAPDEEGEDRGVFAF